ncbi:MAG TPA: helix-turn-helix domain-containing protein [Gemmatimonadales bacterium]|nr:helix-turn-helix domain-containing protein [Gemmatimonadales bacterium]
MPHTVLLVADADRRQALAAALRAAGREPLLVESAEAAAEALAAADPEALVLDLSIPALDLAALREALAPGSPVTPDSLEDVERRHIHLVLRHTGGNRRQAARLLGISRSTLHNKLRRYGLESS